jgi:hypothetical protein
MDLYNHRHNREFFMEESVQTDSVSQADSSPAVETTSSSVSTETQASAAPEVVADSAVLAAPQVPTFTPNFKVKVLNKEYEIPESFRSIVKTPQDEKLVRETFEKAYGLEHVKGDRDRLKEEMRSLRPEYENLNNIAKNFQHFYKQNDLDSAFEVLGIPKNKVFEWAVAEAKRQELPPEQQQVYNERHQANRVAFEAQQRMQGYEQQLREIQVRTRESELSYAVSKPEVADLAKDFDRRNGEGAFRDEVIARGQFYWNRFGKDVSPDQIVTELVTRFFADRQAQATTQAPAPSARQAPPVIPNVSAQAGGTPASRKFNSIEDLKKEYNAKFANR